MSSAGFYFGDMALTPHSELRTMSSFVPFSRRLSPRENPLGERIYYFEHCLNRLVGLNGKLGEGMAPLLSWSESFELQAEQPLQRFQAANSICTSLMKLLEGKPARGSKRDWQELTQLRWESSVLLERVTPRRSLCNEFYGALIYPFPSFMAGNRSALFATPLIMLDHVFEASEEEAEKVITEFLSRVRQQFTDAKYLQFARTTGDPSRLIRAQRRMREYEDRMEMLTLLETVDE